MIFKANHAQASLGFYLSTAFQTHLKPHGIAKYWSRLQILNGAYFFSTKTKTNCVVQVKETTIDES